MIEILSKFIDLIPQIAPWLVPLLAVYLGWHLNHRSAARQRALDLLDKQFGALRELKSVADNVPRGLDVAALEDRMAKDPDFLRSLHHRLVRLIGLRIELLPYLDASTIQLIDEEYSPLLEFHTGSFTPRPGTTSRFALVCIDLVHHVDDLESQLVERHRKLTEES